MKKLSLIFGMSLFLAQQASACYLVYIDSNGWWRSLPLQGPCSSVSNLAPGTGCIDGMVINDGKKAPNGSIQQPPGAAMYNSQTHNATVGPAVIAHVNSKQ